MGRPTKAEIEKREEIENILKRDADYYVNLEMSGQSYSQEFGNKCFIPYAFTDDFIFRRIVQAQEILKAIANGRLFKGTCTAVDRVHFEIMYSPLNGSNLPKEKDLMFGKYAYPNYIKNDAKRYLESKELISKDGQKVNYHANMPIISPYNRIFTHKSALIEIDFTKPLEEIISIVTKIKNDFDKDHSIIQSLGEFLGIEEKEEVYKCDLDNCDIYTEKNPKPMEGRMIDALFIYDCKKNGLTNEYTLNEINRYWNNVKNLFTEKMQDETRKSYLTFMTDLIDNLKYESFLTGTKLK